VALRSVSCVKESSNALGLGFRCGFLGLLHMDVFRQRLEQEFNTDIIITRCPCLVSRAHLTPLKRLHPALTRACPSVLQPHRAVQGAAGIRPSHRGARIQPLPLP